VQEKGKAVSAIEQEIRIARIEERLAWFERHVTAQDKAMLEIAEDVQVLRRELLALRERSSGGISGNADGDPVDERPPHY